jgi:thiamine-monophosphate kinase
VITEDRLIEKIARAVPSIVGRGGRGLSLGIGDDAAVLAASRGFEWVVSSDAFLEGVHFLPDTHPPDSVGYKSLVRAASDLVAVGARPAYFLLTLTLTTDRTGRWLDEFLRGMARAARSLDMRLIGGDTTKSNLSSANLTVFGRVRAGGAVTREGARPGDLIYVSGNLGRAQLGLCLMRAGYGGRRTLAAVLEPHLYPRIPVELGMWLARNRLASAMMDLSDGLSTDLARLCRRSRVGAKLEAQRIPAVSIPPIVSKLLRPGGRAAGRPHRVPLNARQMALDGGDDYELLFTVPRRNERKLRKAPESNLTCVGEITRDRRVLIVDDGGRASQLNPAGWDPFRLSRLKNICGSSVVA